MYLEHYNLTEKPFEITADPKFLWLGEKHEEALAMLKYGVLSGKGFLLLTGDVGTGKTTLINSLVKSLQDDVIVATVPDPSLETLEFFDFLATAFGVRGEFTRKSDFLRAFEQFLNVAHSNGKKVLLIIDEAQRLTKELLEEIRLLSNIEKEDSKLLNIFFVGQDEFKAIIKADECRALRQRIAAIYQINPLTENKMDEYIRHRLKVGGTEEEVFTRGAIEEIFAFSRGYPRLINIVCDHALLTGYVKDLKRIDRAVVLECSHELDIHRETRSEGVDVPPPHESKESRGAWKRVGLDASLALALGLCGYVGLAVGYGDSVRNVRHYYNRLVRSFGGDRIVNGSGMVGESEPERQATHSSVSSANRPKSGAYERPLQSVGQDTNFQQASISAAEDADAGITEEAQVEPSEAPVVSSVTEPGGEQSQGLPRSVGQDTNLQQSSISAAEEADTGITEEAEAESSAVPAMTHEREEKEELASQQEQETIFPDGKLVIPFGYGRIRIRGQFLDSLDRLASLMNKNPDMAVVVNGYTDTLGDEVSNQALGQLRATAVKRYLVAKGISPSRIEALGLGQQNPRALNTTREGRSANRRVEIELFSNEE